MKPAVQQRRQYERFPVRLRVMFDRGGQMVEAHSRDISLGGMFIETDQALPYGTVAVFHVALPSLPEPAAIEVIVRWSAADGMGVQFGTLRARETWAIHQLSRGS